MFHSHNIDDYYMYMYIALNVINVYDIHLKKRIQTLTKITSSIKMRKFNLKSMLYFTKTLICNKDTMPNKMPWTQMNILTN